jgi:RNA polymerase-associated protein
MSLTLYDAPRCPYCARVRIVLAEKRIDYETVTIDLADRPPWIYEKNPTGKVPVLEEGARTLPESAVIMEYLEERYPDPPLLPGDQADRADARLWIWEHDRRLADAYYAFRRGEPREPLELRLDELDDVLEGGTYLAGDEYSLADIAYVPWLLRARDMLGVELEPWPAVEDWLARLSERPAIAAELAVVAAL